MCPASQTNTMFVIAWISKFGFESFTALGPSNILVLSTCQFAFFTQDCKFDTMCDVRKIVSGFSRSLAVYVFIFLKA